MFIVQEIFLIKTLAEKNTVKNDNEGKKEYTFLCTLLLIKILNKIFQLTAL